MPDSLSELENGRTVVQAQIAQLGDIRSGSSVPALNNPMPSPGVVVLLNARTQVTLASWPVLFDCE